MLIVICCFCLAVLIAWSVVRIFRRIGKSGQDLQKEPYIKPASAKVSYLDRHEPAIPEVDQVDILMEDSKTVIDDNHHVDHKAIDDNVLTEAKLNDLPPVKTFSEEDALVTFHLSAVESRPYQGYELLQAILSTGFRYGEMNIFHRYEKKTNKGATLFSLVSSEKPGTFDLPNMAVFKTRGLSLFMDLNKVPEPMKAFEMMLHAAGQLTDDLGGRVLNANRELLTKEMVREVCLKIRRVESSKVNLDLFDTAEIES